jgi:hypothetical protein
VGIDLDPPIGDAGEMRGKAARLGLESEGLLLQARELDRLVAAMDYEGRAADRFRAEVAGERLELEGVVEGLREAQSRLLREANRVEAAQQLCLRLADDARVAGDAVDTGLRDAYSELLRLASWGGG